VAPMVESTALYFFSPSAVTRSNSFAERSLDSLLSFSRSSMDLIIGSRLKNSFFSLFNLELSSSRYLIVGFLAI